MRIWNVFVSLRSSFKSNHPYYLAPPCIYKWNENNKFNDTLFNENKTNI